MAPDPRHEVLTERETIRRKGLDDFMWMEILSRLPSTKYVLRCKCVSKRWNSLVSDRYFIRRFIDHNREKYGRDFNDDLLLFFDYYTMNNKDGIGMLACSSDREYTNQAASILLRPNYIVESSYNDLLVCSETGSPTYYIVNPFTKEHVELPCYDPDGVRWHGTVGFVCEPFHSHGGTHFDPVPYYRYRVVRIVDSNPFGDCRIWIYASETKQWSLSTSLDRFRYGCGSNVVAHGGKLYWYNYIGEVIAYDPFVASDEPHFKFFGLNTSQPSFQSQSIQLAQSQGSLFLILLVTREQESFMYMWKLEEEEGVHGDHEAFRFERTIAMNDIVSGTSPDFIRRVVDNGDLLLALGVHPSNQDVIFMGYDKSHQVASYNLATKEWQDVGEIEHINDDLGFLMHKFGVAANLPWWPTPVH